MKGLLLKSNIGELSDQIKKLARKFDTMKDALFKHKMFKDANQDYIDMIKDFDIKKEIDWLDNFIKSCKYRVTLILFDMNFRNCIVRDAKNATSAHDQEPKVRFIDFDTIQYNLRGIDFGAHFFERVFQGVDIGPESKIPREKRED